MSVDLAKLSAAFKLDWSRVLASAAFHALHDGTRETPEVLEDLCLQLQEHYDRITGVYDHYRIVVGALTTASAKAAAAAAKAAARAAKEQKRKEERESGGGSGGSGDGDTGSGGNGVAGEGDDAGDDNNNNNDDDDDDDDEYKDDVASTALYTAGDGGRGSIERPEGTLELAWGVSGCFDAAVLDVLLEDLSVPRANRDDLRDVFAALSDDTAPLPPKQGQRQVGEPAEGQGGEEGEGE